MRLVTRVWFWLLAIPLLMLGSVFVSFGVFATIDQVLGGSALNVWGDMEGLVTAVWVGAGVLFLVGLTGLISYLLRVHQSAGSG